MILFIDKINNDYLGFVNVYLMKGGERIYELVVYMLII